jgi:hypothetical protein
MKAITFNNDDIMDEVITQLQKHAPLVMVVVVIIGTSALQKKHWVFMLSKSGVWPKQFAKDGSNIWSFVNCCLQQQQQWWLLVGGTWYVLLIFPLL